MKTNLQKTSSDIASHLASLDSKCEKGPSDEACPSTLYPAACYDEDVFFDLIEAGHV